MPKKFFLTVTGASLIIIFFSVINKVLGMIREIIFANNFGLSQSFEIYLLSGVIPIIINTFVLYVGQNFFIPQFNRIKCQDGETKARVFFNKSLTLFFLLCFLASAGLFVSADFVLKLFTSNLPIAEFLVAKKILRIILFTIPLNGLMAIILAYLQAEYDFKNAFISHLFLNVTVIIIVLSLTGKIGIYSLPIGFLLGTLLQVSYLFIFVRKKINAADLFKGKVDFAKEFPLQIFFFTILIELIGQLYIFIDRLFYSSVQQGGIAALNYAGTIYLIPVSILSMAFSTAIFSKFSESIAAGNFVETENSLNTSLRITFFFFIPSSVVFILYGNAIVDIFYHRGAFTGNDVVITAEVLKIYGFSLVFFSAYAIINKLLFGIAAVKQLLLSSTIVIIVKIVVSYFLVTKYYQNGLAAASTISYVLYFFLGIGIVIKKLNLTITKLPVRDFVLALLNSGLSFLVVEVLFHYFFPSGKMFSLIKIFLFFAVYFSNALVLKDETMNIAEELFIKTRKYFYK